MRTEIETYWPALPFPEWKETAETLHMWTQIVGKLRLTLSPWTNHSWHVTLYVNSRGLTTSPIPCGARTFEIQFDFIDHQLRIETSDGERRMIELKSRSVADFYRTVMKNLDELHLPVHQEAGEVRVDRRVQRLRQAWRGERARSSCPAGHVLPLTRSWQSCHPSVADDSTGGCGLLIALAAQEVQSVVGQVRLSLRATRGQTASTRSSRTA